MLFCNHLQTIENFQIVSDVHLESNKLKVLDIITPIADNLIVAGDLGCPSEPNYKLFFEYVTKNWKNVFYVPGNHEYYDLDSVNILNIDHINQIMESIASEYPNLYLLNNSSVKLGDITIIGSILWSKPDTTDNLTDFQYIYDTNGDTVTLDGYKQMNNNCINYLENEINDTSGKIIVITHFMPLFSSEWKNNNFINENSDDFNESYHGNNLHELVKKVDVWVSGHIHDVFNEEYKGTKWLCNAYGQYGENLEYKPMVFRI